jgi:hypothetical protein
MSTPVTNPAHDSDTNTQAVPRVRAIRAPLPDDGTRPLLQGAFWTLLTGVLAALATRFLFGGVGIHGPHTNGGWLSLIVAMMCLPFGLMLLLLGGAKYLRHRRLARTSR